MQMAKVSWFSSWPESKVMVGICCTLGSCLLLVLLHQSTGFVRHVTPCGGDCKQLGTSPSPDIEEIERLSLEHIGHLVAEMVANLSNSQALHRDNDSHLSPSSVLSQQEVPMKVTGEWQLPAIKDDRPYEKLDDPETYGEARRFKPLGSATFLFIQFGAYRGGSNSFAVVGLGARSLHVHGNPGFECSWVSNNSTSAVQGITTKYYPDWNLGKQYGVVVVNCTFESDVGVDGRGGRLDFVANHGSSDRTGLPDVQFVALTEEPNKYDGSIFGPPYRYDYLYCGSPLFGSISPQRIREWIAYHVRLFGPRSHFILYDAGGIHADVRKVLQPWMNLGYISLINLRQEARYDVFYYSQWMISNDCLFQAKTLANWTFFFDVDEYIHIPDNSRFDEVMLTYHNMGRKAQQVMFKQNLMDFKHCRNESLSSQELQRQWGFEKLVYKCMEDAEEIRGFGLRKFVIQAQYALATGVHGSENMLLPENKRFEETSIQENWRMTYYHYHNAINKRSEVCEEFVDATLKKTRILNATHVLDTTMVALAAAVRDFENRTIGPQPILT